MRRIAHLALLSSQSHANTTEQRHIHSVAAKSQCGVCVLVCECTRKSLLKIPNESPGVERRCVCSHTAVDQSAPTRCKSHTPQVGTGEEGGPRGGQCPTASAILLGPPAVRDQEEGPLPRDGNPCNYTTQVVHFGGRLLEAF